MKKHYKTYDLMEQIGSKYIIKNCIKFPFDICQLWVTSSPTEGYMVFSTLKN